MAKDIYHNTVRMALEKDGWTITNDPLTLKIGGRLAYVDLGAEKLLAAEKEGQRIAVEVKSFIGSSPVQDLEQALGQYIMYSQILERQNSGRLLYLAIPENVFLDFFSEELPQLMVEINQINLLVFDSSTAEILRWMI
ncbi:MAG TPA: fatty-acid synthase [Cyanobacteria bacterium UBA11149]|nr:fatty-acid synthase [Cyanobacteria bacterium UBA11367]HBE57442.1 fatty-acid synthase [Cyanobacteria bacterium UBA11366]HBK66080.1 fatty-acid synthase [Cyanobacteria bacterium UBA11166]HBR76791.1 fatty-acid synthase [Cyanobacteria bacterium UBA11159]HBS71518.1 fatty-acid synthase [Cyanobacteria bacterium UBA11153]HBW89440.1 fatty-acid synthase [Cyanobacteria bacterium UBA11149]HCA97377.1 fatty-acid synthase [Cyanobacteria bacterium UBA9226]